MSCVFSFRKSPEAPMEVLLLLLSHVANILAVRCGYRSLKQVLSFSPEKDFKLTVQAGDGWGLWH